MCCPGCQAVATAIVDGGLGRFYQYRSANAVRPEADEARTYEGYDLPEVQAEIVESVDEGLLRVRLVLGGITCAACAWLIEKHLQKLKGIRSIRVNVTQHQCSVEWSGEELPLSRIFSELASIGYEATPVHDEHVREVRQQENRRSLQRLGVAGLGMMQAGMVAVALYAGAFQGMEAIWETLLRWVSLFFATPVVFFSAQPFFRAAWRSLKFRTLTMDVSVSLAIGLAYVASCWATLTRSGEVYFDSVVMFTFFLLLGRYLEMNIRHRNAANAENMGQLLPLIAQRVAADGNTAVPVRTLKTGDRVLISAGDIIPCDGEVIEGRSAVVESLLTGESEPVSKASGDIVSAGTCNTEHPLQIKVTAVGVKTRLSAILSLTDQASSDRPRLVAMADSISSYFVAAVVLISIISAAFWWQYSLQDALWVTMSVLVVTCPCALSLATPAALAVATGELRKRGLLISRGHVLETLALANRIVFDKTGTLTTGNMTVASVIPLSNMQAEQVLPLVAAMEAGSNHPIGKALSDVGQQSQAVDIQQHIAEGVSATIDGLEYGFGRAEFVVNRFGHKLPCLPEAEPGQLLLLLASRDEILAWIVLQDQLRVAAGRITGELTAEGLEPVLCSGDRRESVSAMAQKLSIATWFGGMSPADKLRVVRDYQNQGDKVVMVGDGINDVPVLSGADVSIAMGSAADFAQIHADSVLLSGNLGTLTAAVALARKTRRVIRQNLAWALLYNLMALPLAVMGMVPPWAAAIGMSASSLLVVSNAMRLGRGGSKPVNEVEYKGAIA